MIRVQFGVNKHKFIFRDDKIAQAHKESTIFSLWKIYKFLFLSVDKILQQVLAFCNLHLCFNFALVLHEKCTSFQLIRSA